jgi:hypothetical protein
VRLAPSLDEVHEPATDELLMNGDVPTRDCVFQLLVLAVDNAEKWLPAVLPDITDPKLAYLLDSQTTKKRCERAPILSVATLDCSGCLQVDRRRKDLLNFSYFERRSRFGSAFAPLLWLTDLDGLHFARRKHCVLDCAGKERLDS